MSDAKLTPPVSERDHAAGPEDAPVTLVEYGDYECPYCGMAYPIVKRAQLDLGNRLRFVFRNFPLAESHPHARLAAEAAEAAGAQGKFWEMHDMLYEHQDALEAEDLTGYAKSLGLDVPKFAHDLEASGVNGTPTFFVNGNRYEGSWANEKTFIHTLREAAQQSGRGAHTTADANG